MTARVFYLGSQALFLQAARVNHSCLPNAAWHIDGQRNPLGGDRGGSGEASGGAAQSASTSQVKISMRTKRAVQKGEELTIDYIPDLAELDVERRRDLLQQEYGFLCDCAKCTGAVQNREAKRVVDHGAEAEAEEVW